MIGVITKIDAVGADDVEAARNSLKNSGVGEIYAVSSLSGEGMEELAERVRRLRRREAG
ncbi:MAG: Ethanolamine utilization - propanediol utilization [Synergistetes bacterium ADurb.BinA166]|nr:MAG: Ethanolamine utilization - propanediol utilization [Synergistetes bacterium ADurb.BinA166]